MTQPTKTKMTHACMFTAAIAAAACLPQLGCVSFSDKAQDGANGDEGPGLAGPGDEDKTPAAPGAPDVSNPTPGEDLAASYITYWGAEAAGERPGTTEWIRMVALVDALPAPGAAVSFIPRATVELVVHLTDWNSGTSQRVDVAAFEPAQVEDYTDAGYTLALADGTRVRIEADQAYVEYGEADAAALAQLGSRLASNVMAGEGHSYGVQGDSVYATLPGETYEALPVAPVENLYGGFTKRVGNDAMFVECFLGGEFEATPNCIYVFATQGIAEVSQDAVLREATITGADVAAIKHALLGNATSAQLVSAGFDNIGFGCDAERCTARWWQGRNELLGLAP